MGAGAGAFGAAAGAVPPPASVSFWALEDRRATTVATMTTPAAATRGNGIDLCYRPLGRETRSSPSGGRQGRPEQDLRNVGEAARVPRTAVRACRKDARLMRGTPKHVTESSYPALHEGCNRGMAAPRQHHEARGAHFGPQELVIVRTDR